MVECYLYIELATYYTIKQDIINCCMIDRDSEKYFYETPLLFKSS